MIVSSPTNDDKQNNDQEIEDNADSPHDVELSGRGISIFLTPARCCAVDVAITVKLPSAS